MEIINELSGRSQCCHTARPFDPRSQPFDPRSQRFDPRCQPFDPRDQRFDRRSQPFDRRNQRFDPRNQRFDRRCQPFGPRCQRFDPRFQRFDPRNQRFDRRFRPFDPRCRRFDPRFQPFGSQAAGFHSRLARLPLRHTLHGFSLRQAGRQTGCNGVRSKVESGACVGSGSVTATPRAAALLTSQSTTSPADVKLTFQRCDPNLIDLVHFAA